MKRKVLFRCVVGGFTGVAFSTLITIAISLIFADGHYHPVVPQLITDFGNEMNAVLVQAVFSFLYGAACAGASMVWDVEGWSILRQTVTHLIIYSASTLPIAYFLRWMPHSVGGVLIYFAIFLGIYLIIWLWQYSAMKKRVQQMNEKVKENNTNSK